LYFVEAIQRLSDPFLSFEKNKLKTEVNTPMYPI